MNTPLTVYTLPSCMQCTMTKRALDNASVPYVEVELARDQAAIERFRQLGHLRAPIVVDGPIIWSGFQPDQIKAAASARAIETKKEVMA